MVLYSVMLVDDEEEVREAIARKVDWEKVGFQVVASAENGEEALQLAERLRPDVVMTDIKMPFMDGLTFCRKLKEVQKSTKVVIFSGFDEFEYAKEAIKLEVEEYVLKPIDANELTALFGRIRETLDKEIDEKRNVDKLYRYYEQSLPIMKDQFLVGLLEGRIPENRIGELSESYEMKLDALEYGIGVIRTEALAEEENQEKAKISKAQLAVLSLKNIVEENLRGSVDFRSVIVLDSVVILGMFRRAREMQAFIHNLDESCKIARRILGTNTTAGVGQQVRSLKELHSAYTGAVNAVEYRILLEPNQAIFIQDIEPESVNNSMSVGREMQEVLKEIKLGSTQELEGAVERLISLLRNSRISLHGYQISRMEMVMDILKMGRSYQLEMEQMFGENFDIYRDIHKFESLDALKVWLLDVCMKLRTAIRRERTDSAKLLADRAKQYIQENYRNSDISVDTLCSQLNVSAAYFSTIFKRETGENFIAYLTTVRMEAAVGFLKTTEEKTYIISSMVGYTEPNYFSYVFKKQYGISPTKYRASNP